MSFLFGHVEMGMDLGPEDNMDDIEDLAGAADVEGAHGPSGTDTRRHSVLPRSLRTYRCEDRASGDNIPGVGSVYVKTWGCAHNTSDGEYMAGLLADYGYRITPGTAAGASVAARSS